MNQETITIVSGLPRSGTSMMMKMIQAGGIEPMTDNIRQADKDNPKGYFELEKVKELDKTEDKAWLADAQGKVIKIISQLLKDLPPKFTYKVVFMRRKMKEILASQKQMLVRRGEPTDSISDEELANLFNMHVSQVESWLEEQSNFDVIYVPYNDAIEKPSKYADDLNNFLGGDLDVGAMTAVVDKSLHRQRA
ncbi:MAG: sulfotransferase domain-containing protein [Calditrichaeota bacterium]|nr:sulfotransferase domain-containing protein [Calditrichota bacterium]